ncbi:MAG: DUF1538 domain-containing protein, partial [Oscillospiraceae bacterium]|nr:DUF1538 domain-containing protein [Oscillospiraceae bacterium]
DAGGVASGPLTATFLLPLAMGACSAVAGGDIATDAFGIVAMVAMTPLLTIQILGLISMSKKTAASPEKAVQTVHIGQAAFPIILDESCDKAVFIKTVERSAGI